MHKANLLPYYTDHLEWVGVEAPRGLAIYPALREQQIIFYLQ
jgi:hypothetical protein